MYQASIKVPCFKNNQKLITILILKFLNLASGSKTMLAAKSGDYTAAPKHLLVIIFSNTLRKALQLSCQLGQTNHSQLHLIFSTDRFVSFNLIFSASRVPSCMNHTYSQLCFRDILHRAIAVLSRSCKNKFVVANSAVDVIWLE